MPIGLHLIANLSFKRDPQVKISSGRHLVQGEAHYNSTFLFHPFFAMAFIPALPVGLNSFNVTGARHQLRVQDSSHFHKCQRRKLTGPMHVRPMRISPCMDLPSQGIYAPDAKNSDTRVVIFGATGYIGRFVVFEFIRRGYRVTAFAREKSGVRGRRSSDDVRSDFSGAHVVFGNVTKPGEVAAAFTNVPDDEKSPAKSTVVVSCLASRTGGIADSNAIDYTATLNTLTAGLDAGAKHFILLSAICVQKPELEFQRAKLRFEACLQQTASENPEFSYSVIRPTAFFKSLAGQVERLKKGSAYIMFGDGNLCKCNAISERDLASFIADSAKDIDKRNAILPIGGPGEPVSPREQAEILFRLLDKKPKYIGLPIGIMDGAISVLGLIAKVFPGAKDAAEFGRIGRYYAVEDMIGPSYGSDTLEGFFKDAIQEGGLEEQQLGDASYF